MERVRIACGDEQRAEEVRHELVETEADHMSMYRSDPMELAWGMALEVETKWSGTIYSCRKRQARSLSDVG